MLFAFIQTLILFGDKNITYPAGTNFGEHYIFLALIIFFGTVFA
jgi:hypothetical protein